jgi:hypothetical protein
LQNRYRDFMASQRLRSKLNTATAGRLFFFNAKPVCHFEMVFEWALELLLQMDPGSDLGLPVGFVWTVDPSLVAAGKGAQMDISLPSIKR